MFYTYILKQTGVEHFYVGSTNNLEKRLQEHRDGSNSSTQGRNWELYCYFAFKNDLTCRQFEMYLKSGSGRAFSKKHFEFKIDEALA